MMQILGHFHITLVFCIVVVFVVKDLVMRTWSTGANHRDCAALFDDAEFRRHGNAIRAGERKLVSSGFRNATVEAGNNV
jgi:hypothetical protein